MIGLGSIFGNVLGKLPGVDQLKAKATEAVRKQVDANAARAGAKQLARGVYKGIGAAMNPGTGITDVEKRVQAGTVLAEQAAKAAEELARTIRGYAVAQAARERSRGGAGEAEALAAREKMEEAVTEDTLDIFRAAIGQPEHEGG